MDEHQSDEDVIADVLYAVLEGPLCVNGSLQTLTGVETAEVRGLLETWPAYAEADSARVAFVVRRCLAVVLDYPWGKRDESWDSGLR